MRRVVLFIHGIRTTASAIPWQRELDAALRLEGLGDLASRGWEPLAPEYMDLLTVNPEPDAEEPPSTYVRGPDDQHLRAAGAYWLGCSQLESALGDGAEPGPGPMADMPVDQLGKLTFENAPLFVQARRYCADKQRRHAIQNRILDALPVNAELVIVGYSLGSVVTADLLYHLPRGCRVRLVVTIGSPVQLKEVNSHLRRIGSSFPFELAAPWLNLVGRWDRASAGRGISQVFPEVLDVYVDTGIQGAHGAERYLTQTAMARAFAWADRTPAATSDRALPELRLPDDVVPFVVLAQYALRLAQAQKPGTQRVRYEQARMLVTEAVRQQIREHGVDHPVVDRLTEDNAHVLTGRLQNEPIQLIDALLGVHMGNPVAPHEISPADDAKGKALGALATDLGVPNAWATVVVAAVRAARDAHDGFPWEKAALGAAAVALLVAAPYMVLLAAPAELAGGAAVVGGLAALGGAGGMMGGLAVVGVVGGAGGVAAAGALTAGSAAVVAHRVVFLQARALAGANLGHADPGSPEWFALTAMRSRLGNDHARHSLLDDRKSAAVDELGRKLKAVDTALRWLATKGLGPPGLGPGDSGPPALGATTAEPV